MTDDEQPRVWGYVRVSQESDASVDEQMGSIRQFSRDNDLHLLTTRNDGRNASGFDNDRDEYQMVREKISEGGMDAVITRDRARLSRDFDERLRLIQLFRETGVHWYVVEVGDRLYLEDTQSAMFECLHAGMDHIKKMTEIERSKKAIEERLEQGYYQGGVPFGYRFDEEGKFLEPDPDEFGVALKIIEMRENGESKNGISREVDIPRSTVRSVLDRKETYLNDANKIRE